MMMRRKERQVTDAAEIDSVIADCDCCRLGFIDEEGVYIVPMSFGFENTGGVRTFYFHGAREGRKARCIEQCTKSGTLASFELDTAHEIKTADTACKHSSYYKSVMGTGRAEYIESNSEKLRALNLVMEHNTGKGGWQIPDAMLSHVLVFRLEVQTISCKEHTPPNADKTSTKTP